MLLSLDIKYAIVFVCVCVCSCSHTLSSNARLKTGDYSIRSIGEIELDGSWSITKHSFGWGLVPRTGDVASIRVGLTTEYGKHASTYYNPRSVVVDVAFSGLVIVSDRDEFAECYANSVMYSAGISDESNLRPATARAQCLSVLLTLWSVTRTFIAEKRHYPHDIAELMSYGVDTGLYVNGDLVDSWGRDVLLSMESTDTKHMYRLMSYGMDGKSAGEAENADISIALTTSIP